ncbi:putative sarcosine oxidase [Morus notabilis]|uniref:Putative sarcosine oxidase n=1 Tax=Morus notabilis TaxID=981085 RepID=W9S9T8_9ROSA|nr:probable sarcosine oxidase [Morus notabilis]EXC32739.1 putative sarcosine oxidase [Morus notabilis]
MEYSGDNELAKTTTTFDVIVVGAGVMGSSAAYHTAKRGEKTLLLEQYDFLHHRGSSHGESRTIRATYPEDYYTPLVLKSHALWQRAESEIGYRVYFKARQLDMGPSDSRTLRAVISTCQKHSIPYRELDGPKLHDEFSGRVQIPENWSAISTEYGGVIKPTKAVCMLQTLAFTNGAVLRDNTEVTEIKRDENGGVLVVTANGEVFKGKKCIVTVGAWTKKLIKAVSGVEIPIQPLETTVCYWRIKEGYKRDYELGSGGEDGGFPTFACFGFPYVYGTPSFEFPGLIKVAVHGGYKCDPDDRPWGPGAVSMEELREWVEARFSGRVDPTGPVKTQLCMYSMTPDEDFVLDFLGGEFGEDVVVGAGFSGHGFKMAPAVGMVLADLALKGVAEGVELDKFRLRRFEGNPKGNVKDFEDQVKHSQ